MTTFLTIPTIAERSEATPGLFNSIISSIQRNFAITDGGLGTLTGPMYVADGIFGTQGPAGPSSRTLQFVSINAVLFDADQNRMALYIPLDLTKFGGVALSMRTLAASSVTVSAANTNVAVNEVVFTIGGASGASLCISSGGTTYIFNSALSAKNT